jgi:hypothetical protein
MGHMSIFLRSMADQLEQKIFRCRRFLQQLKKGRRVLLSREFAAELEEEGWSYGSLQKRKV